MPDITDPVAVTFCNESIRPLCDRLVTAYYALERLKSEWLAAGLQTSIPNDASALIDGAPGDGRVGLTGADIHAVKTIALAFLGVFATNANLDALMKAQVNARE